MELGDGRAGGLWGRGREDSSRRHRDTQNPTGAGQCLASSELSMDACSQEIEAGETEGRSTKRREREWDKEGVRNRDPEGGKRQNWGWEWLWSHRETIEESRQNELYVLGPGTELSPSLGNERT